VDQVVAEPLASQPRNVRKNGKGDKKSKSASKKPVRNVSVGKRRSKESITHTSFLKVSLAAILTDLVLPTSKCRLRLLRQERVKDYILME
jgi:hypothetical protein